MNTKTVKLNNPATLDGKSITSVTMRRPKIRDRFAVRHLDPAHQEVTLIANLCDVTEDFVLDLYDDDYAELQDALTELGTIGVKKESEPA